MDNFLVANDNEPKKIDKSNNGSKVADVLKMRRVIAFRKIQLKVLRFPVYLNEPNRNRKIRNSHGEISELSVARIIIDICHIYGTLSKPIIGMILLNMFCKPENENGVFYLNKHIKQFRELDIDLIMRFIEKMDLSLEEFKLILFGKKIIDDKLSLNFTEFINENPNFYSSFQQIFNQQSTPESWKNYFASVAESEKLID